jgi:hypothetical protein
MNSLSQTESNQLVADTLQLEFGEQQYLHIGLLPEECDSGSSRTEIVAVKSNSRIKGLEY